MTPDDAKQLAIDLHAGRVFTSNHLSKGELDSGMLTMVFMVLGLMDQDQLNALAEKKAAVFYEYMDKASPRSINGRPSFFSFRYCTEEDWDLVIEKWNAIDVAVKAV